MISGPCEILLVEDNPDDVELALHAFRKHKLTNRIVVARDGAEALEFLLGKDSEVVGRSQDVPRVILLDLKLPKVDGLEVLKAIKTDGRTRTIPVVIMTSSQEQRDVVDSYHLGVNSYVVKPVEFDHFSKAVSDLGCYWVLLNHSPGPPLSLEG